MSGLACGDGELDINQLRLLLVQGNAHLVVSIAEGELNGAAAIELQRFPNYTVCHVISIGGRHIVSQGAFDQLAGIAKGLGATQLQGWVPEAIARLYERKKLGFHESYRVIRREL